MFPHSQRTAPRALSLHRMSKRGFGSPYSARTLNAGRWTHLEQPATCFRALHKSSSQLSLKSLPSLKSSKSVETRPVTPDTQQTSIIEAIKAVQWNDWKTHFTASNAMQAVQRLPSNTMAAYAVVVNSREYELVRNIVVKTFHLTVHIGRTAYLWLGLFLESREYYYLRYYTLLMLEHTIKWLRYGLRSTFDLIRHWAAKSGPAE
uniref:Uncharacterized protein n=1 Tax=Anopheles culicifacies TaxID=139723 RepID=A0A182MWM8_9DIPT